MSKHSNWLRASLVMSLSLLPLAVGCQEQAGGGAEPGRPSERPPDGGSGDDSGLAYSDYAGALKGYADLHIHMFGEVMFDGGWLYGVANHSDYRVALRRCSGNLDRTDHAATRFGPLNEFLSGNGVTDGDAGWHWGKRRGWDERSWPFHQEHWEHWPSWDAIAHQQVWQGHAACVAGLGIIQSPRMGLLPSKMLGELVEILPQHTARPLPLSLVHAHGRSVPRHVRVVMSWIAETVRQHLG